MRTTEVVNQASSRINRKGRTRDKHQVRTRNRKNGTLHDGSIQRFFVQNHIRLDNATTAATRNAIGRFFSGSHHLMHVMELSTAHAVVSKNASMQLEHVLATSRLMQAVDVLGNDGTHDALFFQLSQLAMRTIGLCLQEKHAVSVKIVEFGSMTIEKRARAHEFGGILIGFRARAAIQASWAPEVRNAAFGRHASTTKEDHPARRAILDPLPEQFDIVLGPGVHFGSFHRCLPDDRDC